MIIEYHSNNSGGVDWLTHEDWEKLRQSGWKLFGHGDFHFTDGHNTVNENGMPLWESETDKPNSRSFGKVDLGIRYAFKRFDSIQEAIREFEKLTKQDVTEEGCNCCGPPHEFKWSSSGCVTGTCDCNGPHKDYNWGSGEDLLEYIFPEKSTRKTKRQLLEES